MSTRKFIAVMFVCLAACYLGIGLQRCKASPPVAASTVIRVIVPDGFEGLLEFVVDDAIATSQTRLTVYSNTSGIIYLPQPSPLLEWHRLEVYTTSEEFVPLIDANSVRYPEQVDRDKLIAMRSGTVSNNRAFLFVCRQSNSHMFEEEVRAAINADNIVSDAE